MASCAKRTVLALFLLVISSLNTLGEIEEEKWSVPGEGINPEHAEGKEQQVQTLDELVEELEESPEKWAVPGEGINPEFEIKFQDEPVSKKNKLKIEELYQKPDCEIRSGEGDKVHWKYKGTFLDGKEFDSGTFTATLGAGHVIVGVDKGMRGLCVGDKRKMTIHSDWAYGDRGYPGSIPAGATLIFKVELLSIERPDGKRAEL